MQPFLALITPLGGGGYPDQSLPGNQPRPDQSLPGNQPYPDQGLPGYQPRPDQSLPGNQPYPDQGLPRPQPGPSHPIFFPPEPGHPAHPIELPPNLPPSTEEGRPIEWKVGWTPSTGWVVVGIPTGPHPTPSK